MISTCRSPSKAIRCSTQIRSTAGLLEIWLTSEIDKFTLYAVPVIVAFLPLKWHVHMEMHLTFQHLQGYFHASNHVVASTKLYRSSSPSRVLEPSLAPSETNRPKAVSFENAEDTDLPLLQLSSAPLPPQHHAALSSRIELAISHLHKFDITLSHDSEPLR